MSMDSGNTIIIAGYTDEIDQFLIALSYGTSGLTFRTVRPMPIELVKAKSGFASTEELKKHYDLVCQWFSENWDRSECSSFIFTNSVEIRCEILNFKVAIIIEFGKKYGCYEYCVNKCSNLFPELKLSYQYFSEHGEIRTTILSEGKEIYTELEVLGTQAARSGDYEKLLNSNYKTESKKDSNKPKVGLDERGQIIF